MVTTMCNVVVNSNSLNVSALFEWPVKHFITHAHWWTTIMLFLYLVLYSYNIWFIIHFIYLKLWSRVHHEYRNMVINVAWYLEDPTSRYSWYHGVSSSSAMSLRALCRFRPSKRSSSPYLRPSVLRFRLILFLPVWFTRAGFVCITPKL